MNSKFIRFLFVGILNTLFGYSIYVLFLYCNLSFSIAALLSTIIGVLFNFKTTGRYVFRSDDNKLIFRFITVYALLYLFNVTGIKLLNTVKVSYVLAGALMLIPMAILSFLLNKKFVFKHDQAD
jgi:putative flippase GtrA